MPKLEWQSLTRKISVSRIRETGNVREDYSDIEELADSIRKSGLLQPVAVKVLGRNDDGDEEFELVAGHRRLRAFRYLLAKGEGFSLIDAVIVRGEKLTLQLIENLQRADLTARERERGVYLMTKEGAVAQTEVAALLGKSKDFISRNIAAYKARRLVESTGVDTSDLETQVLCEIHTAETEDLTGLINEIKLMGGTVFAARRIMREYRERTMPSRVLGHGCAGDAETPYTPGEAKVEAVVDVRVEGAGVEAPRSAPATRNERRLSTFDAPQKTVKLNDVLLVVNDYIEVMKHRTGCEDKIEAAYDIIALLHKASMDGRL
jgi:ParB/RepB/Spo0J family partition protein